MNKKAVSTEDKFCPLGFFFFNSVQLFKVKIIALPTFFQYMVCNPYINNKFMMGQMLLQSSYFLDFIQMGTILTLGSLWKDRSIYDKWVKNKEIYKNSQ